MSDAILVVDDHPLNLKLARLVLEKGGYEVRTACDGEALMSLLESFRPRLILMDVQLPGVDGLELTRRLKSREETRNIIVIAFTAYAMKEDRARALAAGCDGYIAKPIDTRTLSATVAEYLATEAVHS